jgi:hypothetical protein
MSKAKNKALLFEISDDEVEIDQKQQQDDDEVEDEILESLIAQLEVQKTSPPTNPSTTTSSSSSSSTTETSSSQAAFSTVKRSMNPKWNYGETVFPKCFVCLQRHDEGECKGSEPNVE